MREIIRTTEAPTSPLFAQAVRAAGTIYVSGTVGIDPAKRRLAGPTVQEQTRQAVANCARVLAAAGATLDDVVEVGVLLVDPGDFDGLNEVYAELFPVDPPARYVAALGARPPGVRVSVRMTAVP
jgi:2-iminobutanoate/2-iminopropanoate deaminase